MTRKYKVIGISVDYPDGNPRTVVHIEEVDSRRVYGFLRKHVPESLMGREIVISDEKLAELLKEYQDSVKRVG